ncbi:hypothetical protein [Arthrobacter sp. CG_A4]|uniref:hypothetical protein n=1 Tax=Arthrobacter sp. CG_A4 TaxID=3071706 RepID=UPI002DFDFEA4|nr:hypothetical protein [Arthrobacter sp. CG_A4]
MDLPEQPGAAGDAEDDRIRVWSDRMAIRGADIAQLKTLGTKLQAGSSEIDKQKSLLTKVLGGTDWKGPDADKFRSEWNGQHTASLAKVSQALQEAGKQASRNASEQESTSR